MLDIIFSEHTLITGLGLATPLLFCALGGALCSKAGNFNIALEGFMLIGAFFGVVGSYYFKSPAMGVLLALAASSVTSLLYGVFLLQFKAHEVILGFGFNMFAIAITGWLLTPVFGGKGSFYDPTTPSLKGVAIPIIKDIPILRCLSGYNILVYLGWASILILYLLLYKTSFGYKIRALGENKDSLTTNGFHSLKYTYLVELLVGVCCGFAGAYLSIGGVTMFTENMTAGRGYIAVAAVGFSGAFIPLTAFASIMFGIANAVAIQLQGLGMPTQFVDMIPYVLTIVMLLPEIYKNKKING